MIVVYCSHTDTFASNFRCVNKHGSGAWRSFGDCWSRGHFNKTPNYYDVKQPDSGWACVSLPSHYFLWNIHSEFDSKSSKSLLALHAEASCLSGILSYFIELGAETSGSRGFCGVAGHCCQPRGAGSHGAWAAALASAGGWRLKWMNSAAA